MAKGARNGAEGIVIRHSRDCASSSGVGGCDCRPGYQAQVYSSRDRRTIRKTFGSLTDARAWRAETQVALRRGTLRAPSRTTLTEEGAKWLSAAQAGVIRNRSGDPYKPSALRRYEQALEGKVLPELGHLKVSAISRNLVQDLVDQLSAAGLAPSTVRNSILPLRAIFRHLISRSEVFVNPTLGLSLPAVRVRRERIARPSEADGLLGALRPEDRPPWATALYAGLRRGELQALRWSDLDFEAGVIRVERSRDTKVGPIEPKSRAGRRRVPLGRKLRLVLVEHRLRTETAEENELVFGSGEEKALAPRQLVDRAKAKWKAANLEPIGLHECRHTYAAFMIAAGVNAKALSTYMGHSSITVTPSAPTAPPPGCRCGPCRSGWATPSCRPPKSTPTTPPAPTRRRWSNALSLLPRLTIQPRRKTSRSQGTPRALDEIPRVRPRQATMAPGRQAPDPGPLVSV